MLKLRGFILIMDSFISRHINWLSPFLVVFTMVCAFTIGLDVTDEFSKINPIEAGLYKWIISHTYIAFYPAALFLVYVMIVDLRSRKTIDELKEEINEYEEVTETLAQNIKELFDGFLFKFATSKLSFLPTDRITLYIHNGEKEFIPFGRSSTNTKYQQKGRSSYPDNQGCIEKGWQDGWHFYNCSQNPCEDETAYIREQNKAYGLHKGILKKLNMKSVQIAAFRIADKHNYIAIVIVESTEVNRFDGGELRAILDEQHDYLRHMILTLKKYIAEPSKANTIEDM